MKMNNSDPVKRYIDVLMQRLRERNGVVLSNLFNMKHKMYKNLYFNDDHKNYLNNLLENASGEVNQWSEVIEYHVLARNCLIDQDYLDAFEYQSKSFKCFVDLIKEAKDENWQLPIMFSLSVDLRLLSYLCDLKVQQEQQTTAKIDDTDDADREETPDKYAEKSAEGLMYCFRNICTDQRSELAVSKRWGMMHLTNQLFKVYFRINKINLCTPLKRAIENSGLKDQFPQPHQVTYKFYVGRQAMFENDYDTAASYFEYAFQYCPNRYTKNKKMILVYLIPVNVLRGYMPKEELLIKYDLKPFLEIVKAVKQGNILKFNKDMIEYEDFFIQNGVYLFLEKLKMITYRNLFKKIAAISKGANVIPIESFVDILKYLEDDDIDNDSCQCILSNLIYEGKIKGYISWKHNKLVVSKDAPFPKLSKRQ